MLVYRLHTDAYRDTQQINVLEYQVQIQVKIKTKQSEYRYL